MKLTLLLGALVVLSGCTNSSIYQKDSGKAGMDSPIIISDGASTHLRHRGSNSDFQISYNGSFDQVTVNDPGFSATLLACKGSAVCPAGDITLIAGWTMDILDAGSIRIMTISSKDNLSVVTNFYANYIDPKADASGDTPGTDITQHDYTFKTASFTNGDGSKASITCPISAMPCKLRIKYHN
jgi:hypothetical protein